jgi:type IV pilus assembly protein PilW
MTTPMFKGQAGMRSERGMSLIEIMVAMTIGLIILLVIGNLFIGSKQNYVAQDDASRTQENSRYSTLVLGRTVRLAGYRSDWHQSYDQIFGAGVTPIAGSDNTGANSSDTIIVRFQGSGDGSSTPATCVSTNSCAGADGTVLDCLGNRIDRKIGTAVFVENQFQVRTGGANGGTALFCSIDSGTNWVEIVPDIQNMQVLYGEKTGSLPNVERYLVAGTAGQNMNNVIALRIALLHRSASNSAAVTDAKTYNLAGTVVGPFNDARVRSVSNMTVGLRNRSQ